jgi:hypothetical protein
MSNQIDVIPIQSFVNAKAEDNEERMEMNLVAKEGIRFSVFLNSNAR